MIAQDATRDLVLPPELCEQLVTLINSGVTAEQLEEGNEEIPPLHVIDDFLQTLRSKKTALNDDEQFNGYLNSLSANIGTLTAAQYNTDGISYREKGEMIAPLINTVEQKIEKDCLSSQTSSLIFVRHTVQNSMPFLPFYKSIRS